MYNMVVCMCDVETRVSLSHTPPHPGLCSLANIQAHCTLTLGSQHCTPAL